MSQRSMGEEHPAENVVPLLLQAILVSQVVGVSPRIAAMVHGNQDPLKHLKDACMVISRGIHPQFIEKVLLLEDPTPQQEHALEGVARAVDDYLNMRAPIWDEVQCYVDEVNPTYAEDAWPFMENRSWTDLAAPGLTHHLSLLSPKDDPAFWEDAIPHYSAHIGDLNSMEHTRGFTTPQVFWERELTRERSLSALLFLTIHSDSWSKFPEALPLEYFSPQEQEALGALRASMKASRDHGALYHEKIPMEHFTWSRLLDLAFLTQEYNLEWALASYDWEEKNEEVGEEA